MKTLDQPILYSFSRCPYAMRARIAISRANIKCELREIVLRDKPTELIAISPKSTVPVLQLPNNTIIDESLDIMLWALQKNDPDFWLSPEDASLVAALTLIDECDSKFKYDLDRYKYPDRFDNIDMLAHRSSGEAFIARLEERLTDNAFLFGSRASIADYAILPFVRQFANTDRDWFDSLPYSDVQQWLAVFLASSVFKKIMTKYSQWQPGDSPIEFPQAS